MRPGTVFHGDCREVMASWPVECVDAVVCDPPYALGFMGREWDTFGDVGRGAQARKKRAPEVTPGGQGHATSAGPYLAAGVDSLRAGGSAFQRWSEEWAREALRVLKPGGHLLAFGGTRTYHRLVCAVEDAGFEIRDSIAWLYGSGFPKSLDVSKAIDKAAGAERDVVGYAAERARPNRTGAVMGDQPYDRSDNGATLTAPATEDAQRWQGWGTALKPAMELIVVARKPLSERSVAPNVLRHGTGGLNVDGSRIGDNGGCAGAGAGAGAVVFGDGLNGTFAKPVPGLGRWPANVTLDPEAAAMMDEQAGELTSGSAHVLRRGGTTGKGMGYGSSAIGDVTGATYGDTGGASRFFYTAKADSAERSQGLGKRNAHPTVKPISLMSWLVRLVTPPEGVVLDPFLGSGTTAIAAQGCGIKWVGIEREAEYVDIARQRLGLFGATEGVS